MKYIKCLSIIKMNNSDNISQYYFNIYASIFLTILSLNEIYKLFKSKNKYMVVKNLSALPNEIILKINKSNYIDDEITNSLYFPLILDKFSAFPNTYISNVIYDRNKPCLNLSELDSDDDKNENIKIHNLSHHLSELNLPHSYKFNKEP